MQAHYQGMVQAKQTLIAKLKEYRENMVYNLNQFNAASVDAIKGLDAAIAKEGEALHHLFGMMQGRAAPAPAATVAAPAPNPIADAGLTGTIIPEQGPPAPGMQSQVAEVITADGVKTTFENGVAVAVTQVNGAPTG